VAVEVSKVGVAQRPTGFLKKNGERGAGHRPPAPLGTRHAPARFRGTGRHRSAPTRQRRRSSA
jgi:hypothetical protein